MLWKLNAAFPSVVWQVYDWYLQANAGYYFMQNAIEPVHIQMNLISHEIMAINKTYKPVPDLLATIDVYDTDSKSLLHEEKNISLQATDVQIASNLSQLLGSANGVSFVILRLKDKAGRVVSSNIYWLSKDEDYKSMNEMAETAVDVKVISSGKDKAENSWTIELSNPGTKLAFFVRPQLMLNGEEVLPSYWTGNYISLLPSESTRLTVSCPVEKLNSGTLTLKVSGWNADELSIPLSR
jgi:exo-1,4-beta-D-glucosaminidase